MNHFNEQSVSLKGTKRVIQYYDVEICCHRKQKTIKHTSQQEKSIFFRCLNEIRILTTNNT